MCQHVFNIWNNVEQCGSRYLGKKKKNPRKSQQGKLEFAAYSQLCLGFPGVSVGKEFACNVGDPGLIPERGRSPGEGNGNPLLCSCLGSQGKTYFFALLLFFSLSITQSVGSVVWVVMEMVTNGSGSIRHITRLQKEYHTRNWEFQVHSALSTWWGWGLEGVPGPSKIQKWEKVQYLYTIYIHPFIHFTSSLDYKT